MAFNTDKLTTEQCIKHLCHLADSPVELLPAYGQLMFMIADKLKELAHSHLTTCLHAINTRVIDLTDHTCIDASTDTFTLLHAQMDACKCLPPYYVDDMFILCLQKVMYTQQQCESLVNSDAPPMPYKMLVNTLANNNAMYEYFQLFCKDHIRTHAPNADVLIEKSADISRTYDDINSNIIDKVVQHIVTDAMDKWCFGEKSDSVGRMIAVLRDYFNDLRGIVAEPYVRNIVRMVTNDIAKAFIHNVCHLAPDQLYCDKNVTDICSKLGDISSIYAPKRALDGQLGYQSLVVFEKMVTKQALTPGESRMFSQLTANAAAFMAQKNKMRAK